jgi:hypothetical protein
MLAILFHDILMVWLIHNEVNWTAAQFICSKVALRFLIGAPIMGILDEIQMKVDLGVSKRYN